MNRIILIGNGFDLAHNLKTSYNDFLEDYWVNLFTMLKDCCNQKMSDGLCSFLIKRELYTWKSTLQNQQYIKTIKDLLSFINNHRQDLRFSTSPLFGKIKEASSVKNWNGIECEYYDFLTRLVLVPTSIRSKYGIDITVDSINGELQIIQTKLIEYLTKIQNEWINDSIINESIKECMLAPFCAKEVAIDAQEVWVDFINRRIEDDYLSDVIKTYKPVEFIEGVEKINNFKRDCRDQIENMGIESIDGNNLPPDMLYPDRIMLLSFNYTKTADLYMPNDNEYLFPINHIHGSLDKPDSVIFGYGDELDNKYQEISNLNNNELLKNMKSIRYLESDNYRNMLTFIESAPYQIYIMGHSCGVSDRTLLNTLFEHPNCVSIKPFYYVNDEQGQDNYIEIVQNISRNFNDPKKMRDRVVNKTYCQPLPQCPKMKT